MAVLRVPYKMLLAPVPPFSLRAGNAALLLIDAQHFTTRAARGWAAWRRSAASSANSTSITSRSRRRWRTWPSSSPPAARTGSCVMHTRAQRRAARIGSDLSRQMRTSRAAASGRRSAPRDPARKWRRPTAEPVFAAHDLQPLRRHRSARDPARRRVDTLLLAGMLANHSVWQAAREAADRDFGVVVVMDCCASETLAWHTQLRTGVVGGLIRQRSSRRGDRDAGGDAHMKVVRTVNGDIAPRELGVTQTHEHLCCDQSLGRRPSASPPTPR